MRKYRTDTVALKKAMVDVGIKTTIQLSKQTGINRNTLSLILRGIVQPSAEVMDRLVDVLKIDPEAAGRIFFGTDLRTA